MMNTKKKKSAKRSLRRVVGGVKLPPIEPVKDDDVKTITDIDPDFFILVQGRPVKQDNSYLKYKQNIREVMLKRIVHGFTVDEIIKIEREIENERSIYETASKHFEECQHSFDKFLAHDNDKTIVIMKKSDNLAKDLANQIEEHKTASFEVATLKSKLQYIDETLTILLSLENFLHKASPILWQQSNNVTLDKKHTEIVTIDNNIFHKIDIELIKKRLGELAPPRLFFETPAQILKIFDYLEKQNLVSLLVTEELNCQKTKFFKAKEYFKSLLYKELDDIQDKIDDIKKTIAWNEAREIEIRELFFYILADKLKIVIASKDTLQLYTYAEFAYEKLFVPNDTKLNTMNMIRAIETEYDNLMLDLSCFDLNIVKEVEKKIYEGGQRELRQARLARRVLKDVDKLNKRLKSSYEPSRKPFY